MFQTKKILSILLIALFITGAYASNFPRGCTVSGFGFNGPNLIFNNNDRVEQSYFLVQNRSTRPLVVQRIAKEDEFMSPKLRARLQSENWGAFASDIGHLPFQCAYTEGASLIGVDCREVLDICQYPRVKFALSNMGNYWVSVDKDQHQVITDSTAKGIYLRW